MWRNTTLFRIRPFLFFYVCSSRNKQLMHDPNQEMLVFISLAEESQMFQHSPCFILFFIRKYVNVRNIYLYDFYSYIVLLSFVQTAKSCFGHCLFGHRMCKIEIISTIIVHIVTCWVVTIQTARRLRTFRQEMLSFLFFFWKV
jgi:hypothetical protein